MIFSRGYHLRFSNSRFYPAVIGLTAFLLMISGFLPFEVALVPAVASSPKRWGRICIAGVIGAAIGATVLESFFRVAGGPLINHLFPSLAASHGWITAQDWMSQYGVGALIAIAVLPIAQAPALAAAGLLRVPAPIVLLAFAIGKTARYSTVAFLVARGELQLSKALLRRVPRKAPN